MIDDADVGNGTDRFHYSGHWEHVTGRADGRSMGTSSRSFHVGDTAVVRFVGVQVRLYGVLGRKGGYATLVLDNRRMSDLPNFYAATVQPGAFVYVSPALMPGQHTLSITVSGRHDAHSTGDFVNLDHVAVTPQAMAAP